MALPSRIFSGDFVAWVDARVPPAATGATAYFRSNQAGAGLAVEATLDGDTWRFSISAEVSATLPPGDWAVQFVAQLPEGPQTYRPIERLEVLQGLGFTGEASPLDPRSANEIELADLRVAIRAVYRSAEYRIGTATGARMLKRADLPWLLDRERTLLQRVAAEKRSARGVGRRVLTHFVDS